MASSQRWIITGCSSGFGKAIAREALRQGHRVVATARRLESLNELKQEFPSTCLPLELDVSKPKNIPPVVERMVQEFGGVDVVVNNAGFATLASLEETTMPQLLKIYETIVLGSTVMIQTVLPHLRAQGSGHIINMSAKAGFDNYAGFSAYGGAKFALEGLSEALHKEVGPLGIKVTLIEPGPFRTEFVGKSVQQTSPANSPYAGSVGKFGTILNTINGKQKGDPDKAAALIVKIAGTEKPPFRLPLGVYALNAWRQKLKAIEAELIAWEAEIKATDF